jgi:cytochrome c
VLDIGTGANPSIDVTATGRGRRPRGIDPRDLLLTASSPGDATRGQTAYANCAGCHGQEGEGASAPGLNADPGNVAGDPSWTPPMLGVTARSNMDNMGVALDLSMPKWLVLSGANGHLLETQDFSDAYAFLKTQTTGNGPAP